MQKFIPCLLVVVCILITGCPQDDPAVNPVVNPIENPVENPVEDPVVDPVQDPVRGTTEIAPEVPEPGQVVVEEPQAPTEGIEMKKESLSLESGVVSRYTVQIPAGYSPGEPRPLILALHYGGDVTPWYGAGLIEALVGPALEELGAIIVAPDSIDGGWGTEQNQTAIFEILEAVEAAYSIDKTKTLITGFSMGGAGTWTTAAAHQDRFSAAIPVAGRPPENAEVTWSIPLYVINSKADTVVPIEPTRRYIDKISEAGANVTFIEVDDLPHFSTPSFADPLREAVPWVRKVWGIE